jgi:hypothetical protein
MQKIENPPITTSTEKSKKTGYSAGFSGISKTLSNTSFLDIKKKKEKHPEEDQEEPGVSRNRKFISMLYFLFNFFFRVDFLAGWNPRSKKRNSVGGQALQKNETSSESEKTSETSPRGIYYFSMRLVLPSSHVLGFSSANDNHANPPTGFEGDALDMGRSGPTAESRESQNSNSGQEDGGVRATARRFGSDELVESNSGSRGLIGKATSTKKKNRLSLSYFKRDNAPKELDLDQLIATHNMYAIRCLIFIYFN